MDIIQSQHDLMSQGEDKRPESSKLKRLQQWLFEPRSVSRDEAFRERTIRVTLAIIMALTALAFLTNILFFKDPWSLISYKTMYTVMFLFGIVTAVALWKDRVFEAGLALVALFVATSVGVLLVSNSANTISAIPTFMITVLMASLVLTRRSLMGLGLFIGVLFAILIQVVDGDAMVKSSVMWSGIFVFLLQSALLWVLRGEFDGRLENLRDQVKQTNEARLEADHANNAKSQFLANMSHELRTPLNAIIGYTEIMLNGMAGTFTDKQTQLQTYVQENAHRLLGLINDILDLARVEAGRVELVPEPTSPRKAMASILENMQSLAIRKNIYLKLDVDEDVPEIVMTDVKKLQQVIVNLVSNSIKFTTEGGVTIKLSTPSSTDWTIRVTDTGMGMPSDAADYIFEKFRQVDNSSKREHQGTGLGLAIVKGLVDAMKGTIELQTHLGKGTTFIVTLPRNLAEKLA